MSKEAIATENAPQAIGPYSQAIKSNGTLYVSGQIPINPKTGKIEASDIAGQTKQVLDNIGNILKEAGMDYSNVLKTTVLLSDIGNFKPMNEVYAEYFSKPYPARACFQVAAIPAGALVEIEVVAQ